MNLSYFIRRNLIFIFMALLQYSIAYFIGFYVCVSFVFQLNNE